MNAINPAGQARAEAKRYDIEFPVLVCRESNLVRDYEVTKLPHLFIIDSEGVIQSSEIFLKEKDIKKVLDNLLAKQAKASTEGAETPSTSGK